jgi:hypothetical protein
MRTPAFAMAATSMMLRGRRRSLAEVVRTEGVGVDVLEGRAPHALEAGGDEGVGAVGDPAGGIGVGRAAVRRVVLEAAVARRVVRRGDHDAVGAAGSSAADRGCR